MSNELNVKVNGVPVGVLVHSEQEFIFNYTLNQNIRDSTNLNINESAYVSLTMPVRTKSYIHHQLHPIFEMHLPEGYLLALIKKHFSKLTDTDDLGLLRLLSPSIRGRITYHSEIKLPQSLLQLSDLLNPSSPKLFEELVSRFALNTPLSGVQPKVLAQVENKATLKIEGYIVKSWGNEYPQLALNEFLCMQAVKHAGITVPEFYLSEDDQLFIMKRFDIDEDSITLGFEDMCVLQARSRDDKYKGSYERVAKTIQQFTSREYRYKSLSQFFKIVIMNTLLQNGDGHLKNFGLLYRNHSQIELAPAYDIVCTTAYIKSDVPALTLLGSKRWHNKESLLQFGITACALTKKQATALYKECLQGMAELDRLICVRLKVEQDKDKRALLMHLTKLSSP